MGTPGMISFVLKNYLLGRRLENNVLTIVSTLSIVECSLKCLKEKCCQSINYGKDLNNISEHDCELNAAKASSKLEDITKNDAYVYYEMMHSGNGFKTEPCNQGIVTLHA